MANLEPAGTRWLMDFHTSQQPVEPVDGVVFAFAGQASQYPGMGQQLAAQDPGFAAEWRRIRSRLWADLPGGVDGRAVAELAANDVRRTYREIFAVQYALARTVIASGLEPDAVLGVSTGEISAATVAGRLTEDDAVDLLMTHAGELHRSCQDGGMVAVVGDPAELSELEHEPHCQLGLHSLHHYVLGGDRDGLHRLRRALRERRTASFELPVERGFHSPAIDAAEPALRAGARFGPATGVTFASSTLAAVADGPLDPGHLWSAIRGRIRFVEAAGQLQNGRRLVWLDLGPGSSVSTLLLHNLAGDPRRSAKPKVQTLLGPRCTEHLPQPIAKRR